MKRTRLKHTRRFCELAIYPINGRQEWQETSMPKIEPPLLIDAAQRGKPTTLHHLE